MASSAASGKTILINSYIWVSHGSVRLLQHTHDPSLLIMSNYVRTSPVSSIHKRLSYTTIPEPTGSFYWLFKVICLFNSRNCLENCLGQPGSPYRILTITLKHTNSTSQLSNTAGSAWRNLQDHSKFPPIKDLHQAVKFFGAKALEGQAISLSLVISSLRLVCCFSHTAGAVLGHPRN